MSLRTLRPAVPPSRREEEGRLDSGTRDTASGGRGVSWPCRGQPVLPVRQGWWARNSEAVNGSSAKDDTPVWGGRFSHCTALQ